ncbi:FAD-binding and (Fe-S)-binding domain-containing protein [Pauljensenia sp. UMB3104]|uniref:FAD-binding and (Fe-S)-binding domain-containing protein n=1 Tax=Pauljensenia sp. UMB3104 TaxID=3046331 RepID=UPI0025501FD6|nr:FAD-binding and (Fe-S)-binding domain-containing protein [Pauljensenia sp. UMB3104]MDK7159489.1 FAD-binding and (Fe-S)-binding domain-containing protein [Pauljensenia sp. UMB3104]
MSESFLTDLRALIDVDSSTGTRARYSSDAGLTRIPPLAVAFPRTPEQAIAAFDLARAHGVPLTARGGGTSCASNAIGPGLVLDFSRHMNRVVSIDPEARTATVEPGCVGSTLQAAAAEYGLRFGPDPSSQNRATIAGMVANNACGPHATAWGRTSDNIVSLDCVDGRGRRFTATTSHDSALRDMPGLASLIDSHLAPIRTQLGRFKRQVSGYSLEHLTPEGGRNLAAMLAGTEGTLVLILSITVRLVPLPDAPVLAALGYRSMIEAADDVPALLAHSPLAVEGMDRRLVDVVRAHKGPGAVPALPEGEGWLLVEVGAPGEDVTASLERARALCADSAAIDTVVYPPGAQASALWRIRADGAGLGGRTPPDGAGGGDQQAWPGFEDAAVPPENLGAYLRDFTALMEEFDIDGLLYGHFGDGCVHVRLAMPLETPEGVAHSRAFLQSAARICAAHGGSVSGEHGDGRARGELLRFMYSPEMLDLFARVKHVFDPDNLLNPGVLASPMDEAEAASRARARARAARGGVVDGLAANGGPTTALADHVDAAAANLARPSTLPSDASGIASGSGLAPTDGTLELQPGVDPLDANLRRVAARPMPADGGFAFTHDGGDFTAAVHRCTGVGKCRAGVSGTFMCPSYLATRDEKDVTRGRARILQEAANSQLVKAIDSPEVLGALDLCLACKACSADCPAGVDMARYRSEALFRTYRGRLRPLSHYTLGWLPRLTRVTARVPGLARVANAVMSVAPLRSLAFRVIGLDPRRGMPALQSGTFTAWARRRSLLAGGVPASASSDPVSGASDSISVASGPISGASNPVSEARERGGVPASSTPASPGPTRERGGVPASSTPASSMTASPILSGPRDPSGRPYALVWADSFSQTLDDAGARAVVDVLEANGFAPIVAPDACCGLTWITTGQLTGAKKHLSSLLGVLAPFAASGIPIVGVEPSCTAVLRDDLLDLLPEDPRSMLVSGATRTLAEVLSAVPAAERRLPSLAGVEIVAQPHCHHYSIMGWDTDQALLESLGARVTRLEGCCGLAGNFGMEAGHYDLSVAVASHSLLPSLSAQPDAVYLADGFSCRTQAAQLAGRGGVHLATLLAGRAD